MVTKIWSYIVAIHSCSTTQYNYYRVCRLALAITPINYSVYYSSNLLSVITQYTTQCYHSVSQYTTQCYYSVIVSTLLSVITQYTTQCCYVIPVVCTLTVCTPQHLLYDTTGVRR